MQGVDVTIVECFHLLQECGSRQKLHTQIYSSSLLSIVSDDDISVGFRPLRALLVGERIVQFEI